MQKYNYIFTSVIVLRLLYKYGYLLLYSLIMFTILSCNSDKQIVYTEIGINFSLNEINEINEVIISDFTSPEDYAMCHTPFELPTATYSAKLNSLIKYPTTDRLTLSLIHRCSEYQTYFSNCHLFKSTLYRDSIDYYIYALRRIII